MEGERNMKKIMRMMAVGLVMAVFLNGAFAQDTKPQTKKDVQLRKELVKLKYMRAQEVYNLLRGYQSPQGSISWSPSNESLLVLSDLPEFVEKMISFLKEIDVKPVDLLFTIQLVLGSESGDGKTDESLQNDAVVAELKKLLKYRTFTLLDASLARILDQGRAELSLGKETDFNLQLRPRYVREEKPEIIQLEVRLRQLLPPPSSFTPAAGADLKPAVPQPSSKTLIETQLTMKSGDKTVVGVSKLDGGDKGLILIISGKVIN
jgi:hypothetical protein